MISITILIAVSFSVALLFLGLFIWSVKNNQYEDTYTPSVRMLMEDKKAENSDVNIKQKG